MVGNVLNTIRVRHNNMKVNMGEFCWMIQVLHGYKNYEELSHFAYSLERLCRYI